MWSARGIGKQRLEKSIAVRQGMVIKFVIEASDDNSKAKQKALAEKLAKEAKMTSRLQAEVRAPPDASTHPDAPTHPAGTPNQFWQRCRRRFG